MKNKKGFTLVELLAVIAILAILVIIALPNVINMYTKAKKEAFLTETKKLYSEVEKNYISSSITGTPSKVINSEDNTKLDMTGEKLKYCVILNGQGKVKSMKVSNGEWVASLDNNKKLEDLSIDDLEEGNLDGYKCSQYTPNVPKATNCTFDGKLVQGAEYVNGQYTYRYMQKFGPPSYEEISNTNDSSGVMLMKSSDVVPLSQIGYTWNNMSQEGWGVVLTDKGSTEPVTSKVCTYINDKPVTAMSATFHNSSTSSIDLSSFNTTEVTDMSYMFEGSQASSLNLKNFDTSNVVNMNDMFNDSETTSLDLSNFDTSEVINMNGMFEGSKAITVDLSNFDTSKVTDMSYMFKGSQASSLNLKNFDTSNVINMNNMFKGSKATTIDLSNFDTSKVTNMSEMFKGSQASSLNLNNFNTKNVTNMEDMFANSAAKIIDVRTFNTKNVTSMADMFRETKTEKINLSNFDTSNVTNMSFMFAYSSASIIDISNFNTSKVIEMGYMFINSNASTLDLSSFNTSNVTDMGAMFKSCYKLKTIYVSNEFNVDKVTNSNDMFSGTLNLVGGAGSKYDKNAKDKKYAHIDGGTSNPGYFTLKTN